MQAEHLRFTEGNKKVCKDQYTCDRYQGGQTDDSWERQQQRERERVKREPIKVEGGSESGHPHTVPHSHARTSVTKGNAHRSRVSVNGDH